MEIKAATLNEILIVMVLTGILSFIAFEGLSLYRRMYGYVVLSNSHSIGIYENYLRVQGLFYNADSICKGTGYLKIYRENECAGSLYISDSAMVYKSSNLHVTDTLFRHISAYETKECSIDSREYVDSLFITCGDVLLKFGICIQPERSALSNILLMEKEFDSYENR